MNKRGATLLQIFIVIIGLGVLSFLLWEPTVEGVNVGASLSQIYFHDPFLAYVYLGSVPFFIALYKSFKVLGLVKENKTFSLATLTALRTIKYCAQTVVAFIIGAEIFIVTFNHGKDDVTGGVFMGLLAIVGAGTIAILAARFEKVLQRIVI